MVAGKVVLTGAHESEAVKAQLPSDLGEDESVPEAFPHLPTVVKVPQLRLVRLPRDTQQW